MQVSKNHLQGGAMRVEQKSIVLIILFFLYRSCVMPASAAESKLNKIYRAIGLDAGEICGHLNRLCEIDLGFERLRYRGVSYKKLCLIMQAGMLLELSEAGVDRINDAAQKFALFQNNRRFPLSKKYARVLRADIKKFVFSWLAERLVKYEKTSLYHAYVMQYDCDIPQWRLFPDDDYESSRVHDVSRDFKVYVATVDEINQELREMGHAV